VLFQNFYSGCSATTLSGTHCLLCILFGAIFFSFPAFDPPCRHAEVTAGYPMIALAIVSSFVTLYSFVSGPWLPSSADPNLSFTTLTQTNARVPWSGVLGVYVVEKFGVAFFISFRFFSFQP
jgi:hypothetical protein